MDNAVANPALVSPTPLVPATPGLATRIAAMPPRTQLMAGLGLLLLVGVLFLLGQSSRDSDWRVLFPNLSEKDGGLVIERLAQMNAPYRITEGGGTIMVPAQRVHELRMKLSASGLQLRGINGAPGYELLDKSSFGQTQGQERMNMQRAIEGELTRTIQSLSSVNSARVHLALPNQNGFFREQQRPSASVFVNLHPGHTLDRRQLAGIVHLVASSVPELSTKAVRVIDGNGELLSGQDDGADEGGLSTQQLSFRRELEAGYQRRVLALLQPVVGRDNLQATITADIDFSQVMQTAEAWRPNQGADAAAAVRETRSEESTEPGAAVPAGVPGAQANQPQAAAAAPINGPAQALQAAQGGAAAAAQRRDTATRYELDKTVTVTRNAVGQVRRLTAAVVVNHRQGVDARGKPTQTPLSDNEIQQLTALVQQAVGFDAQRGDVVSVINVPFQSEPEPVTEPKPVWQQPWLVDLARSAVAPLSLALLGLVAVFAFLRPALKALQLPVAAPGQQVSEVVADDLEPVLPSQALKQLEASPLNGQLEAARKLAKENPAAVANIVRGWVSGEAA
jgi:flagellar M-ring protein FliF